MTAPDAAPLRKLVLAELRCAYLRAKLAETEIEFLASCLRDGLIGPNAALREAEQMGWAGFMSPDIVAQIRKACGADVG